MTMWTKSRGMVEAHARIVAEESRSSSTAADAPTIGGQAAGEELPPAPSPAANLSPPAASATIRVFRVLIDKVDEDHRFTRDQVAQLVAAAEKILELHDHVSEMLDQTIVDRHREVTQLRAAIGDLEDAIRAEVGTNVMLATIVRDHVPLVRPPTTDTPADPVVLPFPPPPARPRIEAS